MSAISSELCTKVKVLQRDFPACSASHILNVLLDQNQEIALARVHLVLLKKEEDRLKALTSLVESTGSHKTDSPFALSKDRPVPASLALPPKSAPDLPAKSILSQNEDLNSSTEFSSSQKSDFASSSQSSAGSSGITRQPSLSSIRKSHFDRLQGSSRTIPNDSMAKSDVSPFALSRPSPGMLPHHKSKKKHDITIPDLFHRSNMKETRLMGTNRAKRNLTSTFFDDVMDLPEERKILDETSDIVEVLDEEVPQFRRGKRRKLEIDSVSHLSHDRLSQILSGQKPTKPLEPKTGKPHTEEPRPRLPLPPSGASPLSTLVSTTPLGPEPKPRATLELYLSDDEDYDGSTTVGNESNSSDPNTSMSTLESSSRSHPFATTNHSLLQESFQFSSQPPRDVPIQLRRRNRILEDDDF